MHVAVDLDDVMLDFIGGVRSTFIREFGEDPLDKYTGSPWGPDVVKFTKHPRLLAAGYRSWWEWLRDRDWLWATFPAIDGAIGGVQTLRNQGHYMELVTSKPRWAEPQVWKWLGLWRPPFNQVTIVNSKEQKVAATPADIIIDDKFQTCKDFIDDKRLAILFDRGNYYTHYEDPCKDLMKGKAPRLRIARDWDDVLEGFGNYYSLEGKQHG